MNLNDLLRAKGLDPERVIVLRHRPQEAELNKVLPWLAAERPEVFNAYQQTQGEKLEGSMKRLEGKGYVASFIGHKAGHAMFVGIYSIDASRPMTCAEYWSVPAYIEMKKFGMQGFRPERNRTSLLWFDLTRQDFYADWAGRLIVRWPPPERSWWRRAHQNDIPVSAILEESALVSVMPDWQEIALQWDELRILPSPWMAALSQWRGIYYIFDSADGKGYVGSAYGTDNILGRWLSYGASGHGGNKLLRGRDPKNFRFSILQRLGPDMDSAEVIRTEGTWKLRLHSRGIFGLNEN